VKAGALDQAVQRDAVEQIGDAVGFDIAGDRVEADLDAADRDGRAGGAGAGGIAGDDDAGQGGDRLGAGGDRGEQVDGVFGDDRDRLRLLFDGFAGEDLAGEIALGGGGAGGGDGAGVDRLGVAGGGQAKALTAPSRMARMVVRVVRLVCCIVNPCRSLCDRL
jgi:hypothetical protein